MDYFTKWIEAKPIAAITGNQIKKFVWDNIVYRFGLPGEIISDNEKGSKKWIEEVPHVLWAHRTMIKSSNGDTLFSLTYGTKAVIPAEIGMPTLRTTEIDMVQNDEALKINLDLLEEKREQAAIRVARSKAKMEKYYNSRVRKTSFKLVDLVYRSNAATHTEDERKLGPKWEGSYEVKKALGRGAYKLKDRNGKLLMLNIHQRFAFIKHTQDNGLVERANISLGEGVKARLEKGSKKWIEEVPHVLWAHRTMIKSSNGDTLFSLIYGTKAVIPAEIGMPTLRTTEIDMVQNDEALKINLDLLEEKREQAAIREARSKAKMEKYYNSRVRKTSFKLVDLVYRSNDATHTEDERKLGPKWEGSYEVKKALGRGAYKLKAVMENSLCELGMSTT
nr:reverse transcriptase domain-containing protein [Tanacetum cinerariifolium]